MFWLWHFEKYDAQYLAILPHNRASERTRLFVHLLCNGHWFIEHKARNVCLFGHLVLNCSNSQVVPVLSAKPKVHYCAKRDEYTLLCLVVWPPKSISEWTCFVRNFHKLELWTILFLKITKFPTKPPVPFSMTVALWGFYSRHPRRS